MKLGLEAYRNLFGFSNMTRTNPSMKQKRNHRHGEQTGGCQGSWTGGRMKWEAGISRCKPPRTGRINKATELHSISYDKSSWERILSKVHMDTHTHNLHCWVPAWLREPPSLWLGRGELSVLIPGAVVSRGSGQHLLALLSVLLPPGGGAGSRGGKRTAGWGALAEGARRVWNLRPC